MTKDEIKGVLEGLVSTINSKLSEGNKKIFRSPLVGPVVPNRKEIKIIKDTLTTTLLSVIDDDFFNPDE